MLWFSPSTQLGARTGTWLINRCAIYWWKALPKIQGILSLSWNKRKKKRKIFPFKTLNSQGSYLPVTAGQWCLLHNNLFAIKSQKHTNTVMLFTGTCQNTQVSMSQKSHSDGHREEGRLLPICSWQESHPGRQREPTHRPERTACARWSPQIQPVQRSGLSKTHQIWFCQWKRFKILPPNRALYCFTCPVSSNQPQMHICALHIFSSWLKRPKWNQELCKPVLKASLTWQYRSLLEMSMAASLLSETNFFFSPLFLHFPKSPTVISKPKSLWDINKLCWHTSRVTFTL